MSYKRCCIAGCASVAGSDVVLHEFPNPAKYSDRFKIWIKCVGGDMSKYSAEYIHKNRRICRKHFETKYLCRNNRLSPNAVPTLDMPCQNSPHSTEGRPLRQIQNVPIPNVNILEEIPTVPMQCDILSQNKENIATSSNSTLYNKPAPVNADNINKNLQKSDTKKSNIFTKVTRKTHMKMSKPEQDLYNKLVCMKRKLRTYEKKITSQARQIKMAKKISSNPTLLKAMENLSTSAKALFGMQFREQNKKIQGRRFTLKEKILCLSILKQSPRAYRFLRKNILTLPAPQTLIRLLSMANIKPGINKKIFAQLKAKTAELKCNEKLCILLYDEMMLKTNVSNNEKKDIVTGFVTNNKETQAIYANHAQVYMIRGIHKNYKQPVAYTFSAGATKGAELAHQIKQIISHLQEAGLKVLATVCDQGTNNRQAIKILTEEARGDCLREGCTPKNNTFKINGEEIVPLYDPPHLLKGIRNNLLTKNLQCEMNGETKLAKWEHLQLLHKENPGYKGIRLVPKLTDSHIVPEKIGKMKVKYASQVFSSTVASNMGYLADKKILPEDCKDTADILLFFDELFDSVNGSFAKKTRFAKPLLGPATPKSLHHETWREGIKILKSMRFINKSGKPEVVPTLNNWVWTLEGYEVLLKNLENKGIASVWMRHFNQDPIENFFGAVRSHGCRNTNPTPERFESAFTALLVNSLTSVHTPGGNCEQDLGEGLITLIVEEDENCKVSDGICLTDEMLSIELEPIENKKCNKKILAPLQYVSGYFIKKAKKIYKSCDTCKNILEASKELEYIKYREYSDRRWLCSPTEEIINLISNMQDIAITTLKTKLESPNIKQCIVTLIYTLLDFNEIQCDIHRDELIKYIVNIVCRFFVYTYCKILNKILNGKQDIEDFKDKYQILAKITFEKSLKSKKKTVK